MKCDELQYRFLGDCFMYDADEVDEAIAELKAENERLKKDIDTLKTAWEQSQSALSTISALKFAAEEKLRATRRALYKACANWAHFAVAFFSSYTTKDRWHKMERKCLKKAKEYK